MTVNDSSLCSLQLKMHHPMPAATRLRQPSPRSGKPAGVSRAALARACLASLLALGCVVSHAQSRFEEDFDDREKSWQEIAIQLPAAPKQENLLEFYVGPIATQTFAIDAKSLSVGNDGVVRYTLVSRSAAGAENVSYEGIRCESFEKKLYAFGQKDGRWTRSRRDRWEPITGTIANRQHAALMQDYFCVHKTIEGNAEQIVRRIRDKRALQQRLPTQ